MKSTRGIRVNHVATILLPALFMGLAIFWGLRELHSQLRTTEREIRGVHAIGHLYHAMADLQLIRGLLVAQAVGNSRNLEEQIEAMKRDVIGDYHDSDWPELRNLFAIDSEMAAVVAKLQLAFSKVESMRSMEILLPAYTALIDETHQLILVIADRSGLVLDPATETYYLMEASILQTPAIAEEIAKLQVLALRLQTQSPLGESARLSLQEQVTAARTLIRQLSRNLAMVGRTSPELGSAIGTAQVAFDSLIAKLPIRCPRRPCRLAAEFAGEPVTESMTAMRGHIDSVFHTGTLDLLARLDQRRGTLLQKLVFSLTAALGAVGVVFFVFRHYSRKLISAHDALERMSTTDALTGIPNRRALGELLPRTLASARRDGRGFGIGLIDVDFFKNYNDTYGHQAGDLVLQTVATSMARALQRGHDHVFRFGGEEFCFFCVPESAEDLARIAERIRHAVEKLGLDHAKNVPGGCVVTVSVGAVYLPAIEEESPDFLIQRADQMLYAAKGRGRNRCEVATLTPPIRKIVSVRAARRAESPTVAKASA